MGPKKSHNELELKELLSVIESSSNNEDLDKDSLNADVTAFIVQYGLKNGELLAHKDVLYRLYNNSGLFKRVNKATFIRDFSLFFEKKGSYYLLNKNPDELIKSLSVCVKKPISPKIKSKTTKAQYDAFLDFYNVTKGSQWVEIQVINYLYDKWVYETKRKKLIKFLDMVAFMKIFFEYRKPKSGYVFKINCNVEKSFIENIRKAWKTKRQKERE